MIFLVFLLYALFGSVFTIAKVGLEYTTPLFFVGSRMLVAGICILTYAYFKEPTKFLSNFRNGSTILKLGFFNIYLTNVFEFWGLQYLTSFKTCFIYSLSPFLSALFSYFIFSERLTSRKWLGFAVGIFGFVPILMAQGQGEDLAGQLFVFSWAELSVLAATITSVYGWILLRLLVNEKGHSPFIVNGLSMVFGGALALLHSFFTEAWDPIPVTEFLPFAEAAIGLMIISNFICYNLYGFLLKRFSATFMSFAGFTTPVFAALNGFIFLNETITLPFVFSMVLVFAGLTLFYQDELQKEPLFQKIPEKLPS